jgi:WD40 repeat protein
MTTFASSRSTDDARRKRLGARAVHVLASILACTSIYASQIGRSSSQSTDRTSITAQPPPPRTEGISLAAPTVGLFIGVSDYARDALPSTPAHTLSAALMYEPFFNAATGSDLRLSKDALGIPYDSFLKGHARSVCDVAFSPDGTLYVTASDDGLVVLRRTQGTDPPITLRSTRVDATHSSCVLSLSPVGSRVALGENGGVTVWSLHERRDPVSLPHRGRVGSVAFSPDGARLLTASSDGVVRIFLADAEAPSTELLAVEEACERTPLTAFSPDGTTVATAGCQDLRIAPVTNLTAARRLGRHRDLVRDLSFSPDGTHILTAAADGARIWGVASAGPPQLIPIPAGWGTDFDGLRKAVFSADGSRLAMADSRGHLQIMPLTKGSIALAFDTGTSDSNSLQFSPDGAYVLVAGGDGQAYIQRAEPGARAVFVPAPEATAVRGVLPATAQTSALRGGWFRNTVAIRSVALSSDGRRILAGYSDGTIALHPGIPPEEHRGFRVDDLTFLADTSLKSDDPAPSYVGAVRDQRADVGLRYSNLAVQLLSGLRGAPEHMTGNPTKRQRDTVTTTYQVGTGAPVSKQRIVGALSGTVANARTVLEAQGRVLLVTYVSAHGWSGRDGRPYLLPADADSDDPVAWISYEEFLRPFYEFGAEVAAVPADTGTRALVIVILDTCQIQRYQNSGPTRPQQDLSRPGVIVVESTSPGQYAWHWTQMYTRNTTVSVERETRWGFPPPPKAERGRVVNALSARMSVLPVASQRLLRFMIDERSKEADASNRQILIGEWLASTREYVRHMLSTEVPDSTNPNLAVPGQEVHVYVSDGQREFGLFRVNERTSAPRGRD